MNSDDDNQNTSPINRDAERDRVQGSDPTADPLAGGGPAVAPTGPSTADHKIRASQNEPTEDVAAQRREVVGATMAADGAVSDSEPARSDIPSAERYAQMDDGVVKNPDDEYQPSTNMGDKAAPYNQVPEMEDVE